MKKKALSAALEADLVRRAQAGDVEARDALLEQFTPLMWRFAQRAKTRQIEADELFQHCYLAFEGSLRKFDLSRNVRFISYLYTALSNATCRSRLLSSVVHFPATSEKRPGVFSLSTSADDKTPLGETLECRSADGYRLAVENSEQWKLVKKAVNGLPPRIKRVMWLRLRSLTLQEIGDMMGITKERARQIEVLGVKRIRSILNVKAVP